MFLINYLNQFIQNFWMHQIKSSSLIFPRGHSTPTINIFSYSENFCYLLFEIEFDLKNSFRLILLFLEINFYNLYYTTIERKTLFQIRDYSPQNGLFCPALLKLFIQTNYPRLLCDKNCNRVNIMDASQSG